MAEPTLPPARPAAAVARFARVGPPSKAVVVAVAGDTGSPGATAGDPGGSPPDDVLNAAVPAAGGAA
jgi:hypothetical protein